MTEILNPNCSEQVFRLDGSLNEIKTDVLKMLDICEKEGAVSHSFLVPLRKKINAIKTLEEFEVIVFEFTCSYETYFKKEGEGLLVATCNNHDWEDLHSTWRDSEDYHDIAGYDYYELLFQDDNYIVMKAKYDKKDTIFLETEEMMKIKPDYDNTFKFIKRKNKFFIASNNEMMQVKKITDENLKNRLSILANLK